VNTTPNVTIAIYPLNSTRLARLQIASLLSVVKLWTCSQFHNRQKLTTFLEWSQCSGHFYNF